MLIKAAGVAIGLSIVFLGIQVTSAESTTSPSICPAQLGNSVDTIINRPLFSRMRWGVLIQSLSSQETLYSRDADKYFTPASNAKLLTTAAVLQRLGADFRIRTSVYQDGDGVLRVVGRGDPSLKDAQLEILAQQLHQQGIRQIKQLIADDSYFQGETVNPSWEWEDIEADYGAPVNSLILDENATELAVSPQSVGQPLQIKWADPTEANQWQIENDSLTAAKDQPNSVAVNRDPKGNILQITGQLAVNAQPDITDLAVVDPVAHLLRHFSQSLAAEGITVSQTSSGTGSNTQPELAAVESAPLSKLLTYMNLNSDNLYAEALLRALASQEPGAKSQSTAAISLKVLQKTLAQLGIEPTSYILVDGSGLSRQDLISPKVLVKVLQVMDKSAVFRATLPVAGVSGTLKYRWGGTTAAGIVSAKTGTMTGVVALSGYVNVPNYQPLVFSILVNQSDQPASVIRQAMDEIVLLLTRLHSC